MGHTPAYAQTPGPGAHSFTPAGVWGAITPGVSAAATPGVSSAYTPRPDTSGEGEFFLIKIAVCHADTNVL